MTELGTILSWMTGQDKAFKNKHTRSSRRGSACIGWCGDRVRTNDCGTMGILISGNEPFPVKISSATGFPFAEFPISW